ncbi:MAG: hypothetical protein ACLFQB_03645 [Chitinispirillaceae bacterium]
MAEGIAEPEGDICYVHVRLEKKPSNPFLCSLRLCTCIPARFTSEPFYGNVYCIYLFFLALHKKGLLMDKQNKPENRGRLQNLLEGRGGEENV